MWTLATQSALLAIIVSAATTAALLLQSRQDLYIRFAAFALSVGTFYFAFLLSEIYPHLRYTDSFCFVAGGFAIIFTASFFDALVGHAGFSGKKRHLKTHYFGVSFIVLGLTPLAHIIWVKIAVVVASVFLLSARVRILARKAKETESIADGTRLRYLAYAGAIAVLAFCLDLASHVNLHVPALGGVVVAIYLYFICQTLLVSRLLDLHELFGKAAVFGSLALILALVYGVLVMWADSEPGLLLFNTLIASSLILILFEPLKTFLEQQTIRLFFREHYTFGRDIRQAARQLATFIELNPAVDYVLDHIYDSKRATHVSIYILEAEGLGFVLQGHRGPKPVQHLENRQHPVLLRHILEGRQPILRDSIQGKLLRHKAHETQALFRSLEQKHSNTQDEALLAGLKAILSELVIPLKNQNKVVGFLSLQDERLTEAYTKDEIAALAHLGDQLAITVENSRVFAVLKERDRLAALGEMSAGLAHEIRNPLAAIKGAAQALDPNKTPGDETELLQIIVEEVNRLNKVVTEFLSYAKPMRSTFAPIHVNDTVIKTLQLLEHDLPESVELRLDLATGLPEISGDAEQLRQVLINLLINAKDAMNNEGTLRIFTRQAQEERKKAFIELGVADSGPGVSARLREKIFIPFFTTKQKGTGLGLPLCQRIIRDHGGNIEVRSVQGKGSTFIVRLPTSRTFAEGFLQ